ncbi:MAG: formate dehydrogenase, partial [Nitrospirae bacterium]|nr:formate dehydrogenase [Nitrospirota bacterium]
MTPTRLYLSNDTSSRAAGAETLADAWRDRSEIQLIHTSSRGAFFLEPMVERDTPEGREAWFNVRPNDLPRIVAGVGGTKVAEIPFLQQQTRFTFANFGITEPLALDEYQSRGGFTGLAAAQSLSPEAIVDALRLSGLRGRGGAAFPVWNKWQVAQQTESEQKYVVANADEGDAGTYSDRMMMEGDPFRLIEGMMICARAIGATRGYLYCRYEYPAAARAMQFAIQKAREADLFDCDDYPFDLEVVIGAGSYVCGEETALLESLEGRRGVVLAKPPYPAVSGLYGKPTIVSNVLTFATLPNILANG